MHNYYYRILFTLFIMAFLSPSCNDVSSEMKNRNFQMGTIYWPPLNFSDTTIKRGIGFTLESSDILTAQIPWSPLDNQFIKKVEWISSLSQKHNRNLIINIDWMSDDRKGLRDSGWNFRDQITKVLFSKLAIEICSLYHPKYLNLGVEVNFYAFQNAADFKAFVDLYNYTKKLVNDSFPNVKVAVSFQLELLFGLYNNWGKKSSLEVFKAFGNNLDIIAISTYPHSNTDGFSNQENLSEILQLSDKPIGIFETSVPTNINNEKKQKKYLNELLMFLQNTNRCEVVIWTSTADTESHKESNHWPGHLGLLDYNLKPKESWSVWQSWFKLKVVN